MQGSFNPHWSTPPSRFPPPSLARFNSPLPLVFDSPRPPPGSPPPPPPPPPPPDSPPPPPPSPDSPPPPPSPPPGFSYRPSPPPCFGLCPYLFPAQNQFFPRLVPDTRFPPFYSPAVPDSAAVPVSQYCASVSSVFLPPRETAEMRATRSRDHLFQPISLPNSTSRKGQTSGSGGRRKSTPEVEEMPNAQIFLSLSGEKRHNFYMQLSNQSVSPPPGPDSPPPPPPGVVESPTPLQIIEPPLFLPPPPPPPPNRPVCRFIVPNPPIVPIRSPPRKKTLPLSPPELLHSAPPPQNTLKIGQFISSAVSLPQPLPPQSPNSPVMKARGTKNSVPEPVLLPPGTTGKSGRPLETAEKQRVSSASQPLGGGAQGKTTPAPTKTPTSQPLASGSEGKMTPAPTKIPTSQPHVSGSQGRTIPEPKTPMSSIQQFAPGQAESQKRNESTMEEGEIREISKDLTSSKKYELEASSVAEQDLVIHQDHLSLEKGKEERQRDQTSNMEDASSAVEGGETNRGMAKNEKMNQSTHVDQTTPGESKAQKRSEHIVISDDDDDEKSKEFVPSTSIVPAASVLAAFGGEEMQVDETNQAQASPVQTKGKRPNDQMYPFEDGSSTSGGEIREKKLQKLSSSQVGLQASVPESLCNFLDEEVSGSLSSSLLDWASTFGDGEVSSCDLQNGEIIKVGNYQVKEKYAEILLAIMKKHGDISKDFKTSSIMRSFALEGICEIFQGLRIPLKQLTSGTLEDYNSFVKEVAGMGMNVEWLERDLHEISETIDVIKECKVLRDAAEMKKEKFENLEKEFGLMVIEKKKLGDEIEEIKASLESGAIEIRNKRRDMNNIKVKCRNIPKRLLDGLF